MSYQFNGNDTIKLNRGNIASFLYFSCLQQADFEGALSYVDLCLKEYETKNQKSLFFYSFHYNVNCENLIH